MQRTGDFFVYKELNCIHHASHIKNPAGGLPCGKVELEENKRASGLFYPVICSSIPSLNQNGLEAHYLIYHRDQECENIFSTFVFQHGMLQFRTTWMRPSLVSTFLASLLGRHSSFLCPDRGPSVLPRGSGVRISNSHVPAPRPH